MVTTNGEPLPEISTRGQRYEGICDVLLSIVTTGCYWGGNQHARLWSNAINRIANPAWDRNGVYTVLVSLNRYPALLLTYGAGLAAMANANYEVLWHILSKPRPLDDSPSYPLLRYLPHDHIGIGKRITLRQLFKTRLRDLLPVEEDFHACFNKLEYLMGLVAFDLTKGFVLVGWRICSPSHDPPELSGQLALLSETKQAQNAHPLFRAGFFGGSVDRYLELMGKYNEIISQGRAF